MAPLLVPRDRVRICPEGMGSWGQSREIFQSWDTGLGATVPARKYSLKPAPDGNVAVVFQDAGDADTVDRLIGPLAVRPERPLALRYCSSIKSFCADACFASARDKSCMAHVKPRRMQEKLERGARAEAQSSNVHKPAEMELQANKDDDSWLFDDILDSAHDYGANVGDGLSMESFSDICEPILNDAGIAGCDQDDTLESLLNGDQSLGKPPPARSDSLSTVATQSLADRSVLDQLEDTKQQRALNALLNEGVDSSNIMSSLDSLLCPDVDPAHSLVDVPMHELWAASAAEVLGETYNKGRAQGASLKPQAKLGTPLHVVKPLMTKPPKPPKPAVPGTPTPKPAPKPGTPIVKKSTSKIQNMKVSTLSQQHGGSTPKASRTPKSKCVWKQLVTYW